MPPTSPIEFTKWLTELLNFNPDLKELDTVQTNLIKNKLSQCFIKKTPDLSPSKPKEAKYCVYQQEVNHPVPECSNFGGRDC